MSQTYQQIIDKAEIILQDEDTTQSTRRWNEAELLGWAQDAEIEISKTKLDSYPVIEVVQMTAGSQQSLPSRGIQLLDVLSNMSTDGTTRGNIVSVIDKKLMNALNPGWMSDAAATVITHVIHDTKRAPKLYWIYPKSTGNNYLEIMTAKMPDNGSKVIGDSIMLDDDYANTMLHFMLAMCFSKDLDIPQSAQRVAVHMDVFLDSLGRKEVGEQIYSPKKTREID